MARDNNNEAAGSSSPSGPALSTPSPQKVLEDLIAATAHEIIAVESDHPSSSSLYAELAERLGLYMKQFPDSVPSGDDHNDLFDDDDEKPLIDDVNVRCRLLMARLLLDVMLRNSESRVDEGDTTTRSSMSSHVNDLDAEGWKNIRDDWDKLVQWMVETDKIDADADEVQIIQAHLEAFKSAALLRSQLTSTVGKITSRRKQKISQYTNTADFMDSYRDARDEISTKFDGIDDLLLLPDEVISFDFPRSVKTLKELLERIILAMDVFVDGESLPLKALQSNLSTTLRSWERRLDRPALYECGYFKSSHSSETKPASSAKANRKSHRQPQIPEDDSSDTLEDSDDDQILMKLKKSKSNQSKSNQVKSKPVYRSDSDDTFAEPPPQKKRRKRIPYSEEEKTALLDGVKKFGRGKWNEILDDNADLYAVNNRTNINLKDLYRNLTK